MTLFPTYQRNGIRPVKGEGAHIWDESGRKYLDFTSGLGVCNLGHGHPRIKEAVQTQLDRLWHISNLFEIPCQEEAAASLTKASGLGAVFFANSGAEANEAAIKLARRFGHLSRKVTKPEILTFHSSFHGRTLATLTATGQEKVKTDCGPYPDGFRSLPFNDMTAVKQATGEQTVAILLELIQGEGGIRPADPDFVRQLRKFCTEENILLMVDEVQTGLGRTGTLFAFQQYGIIPDVVTLAKGLGNGIPAGAMLGRSDLVPFLGAGSHASTFGGNPVAMSAVVAVMKEMMDTTILEQVKQKGEYLEDQLHRQLAGCPLVKEIRGRGMMLGLALTVSAADLVEKAKEKGLLVLVAGSQVLRLLPPLIVTPEQIDKAVEVLTQGLAELEEESDYERISGI
ncbi:acetylornithine transaminase [Kroppenstedtia pulmonis]|uniref:Acetylornithine aminotransferase n=1 Tax=Kroppenstedtia pulmonis TaxID=1380685 RepID=A0A7D4BIR1_9BACL|nr:acetylornithine transaminase [Kroppenstedtia pulmonis]QKG85655.1 acetylornithine transaminase [Kroppenstedtia pulmonis]